MLDEKQESDDSDDEGNDLPDVGIQAPYVTQKGQQPSPCDHNKGIEWVYLRKPKTAGSVVVSRPSRL